MKEIKIKIKAGGKMEIKANKTNAAETAEFTEKLAEEAGTIEERHKGGHYESNQTSDQVKQKG